jgi:xanthine dehydrogenase accessory factor
MNSASLYHLLTQYCVSPVDEQWFAATVVSKEGSSYRKPGAMMLVNPLGKALGLVSGGCLEANIILQARQVEHLGCARLVIYDSREEGNVAAELGLGCNGRIGVLIQQLDVCHHTVLAHLLEQLAQHRQSWLALCYQSDNKEDLGALVLFDNHYQMLTCSHASCTLDQFEAEPGARVIEVQDRHRRWVVTPHWPRVRLWLIGGGVDAQPVARMAAMLGWHVTVVDHRTAYGRTTDFPDAANIVRSRADEFAGRMEADAVILMSHNLTMDADWLAKLASTSQIPHYIGLLGPKDRKQEVLELAGIAHDSRFAQRVFGPMGLDIGGDLPESIALSVLSQCHQQLAAAGQLSR